MSVFMTKYKDRPAVGVRTKDLTAVFLPGDGGKMASLKSGKGHEYLAQAPGETYRRLTAEGSYVEAECSAFDDMFPTIDPCAPLENAAAYPDHGEVCRLPMDYEIADGALTLISVSRLFPVILEKRAQADENGDLSVSYTLRNEGDSPFPCLWAGHIMFAGTPGARVDVPYGPDAPIRMMFGPEGVLPRDRLGAFSPEGATYKFYYLSPLPEGRMAVSYPEKGEQIALSVTDPVKYLAVWLNSGGFKGMYNIALEPCTAPFDRPDAAERAGCGFALPPKGSAGFTLTFSLRAL